MPESDDLDHVLSALAQSFADIGFTLNVMIELRRNSDRLRPMLAGELRRWRELIDRAIDVL